MDEVKVVITLRSGKEVDQPMPKPVEETRKGEELEPEHIFLKENSMKHCMPPPFPQALRSKKKIPNQAEIWEVLRQVKVNIPLLGMIKQVLTYAKFLKDLCTVKKGLGIEKKAFLTEQVSAICHAPNPGPTRLADPNRFPGRETQDWDSLPEFFFFFFLKPNWCLWVMAHILKQNPNIIYKSKNYHRSGVHQNLDTYN